MKYRVLILFCLFPYLGFAEHVIVKDQKPVANIIVGQQDPVDMQAAELLQDFIKKITGTQIDILHDKNKVKNGDVLIGDFQLPIRGFDVSKIKEDGFFLSSRDGYIRIVKGKGKGTIYGVVTLLENYFNVQCFAENTFVFEKSNDFFIPDTINLIDNPSFRYRQTQSYSLKDPVYKMWHRLEEPHEVFANNLWVHTFNHILPASEFGEKNPEYYSYINGQRRPGTASQWCLTNPEVFEIVAHRVDSIFKIHPGKTMISVSQNDSQTHCFCDKCSAIDEYEGSPSGTLIHFLNKLAQKFPDKEFSTLAYLYSVAPPKHIKPLPNVNIMLCDIDCYREVTLPENKSGQTFVRDMEGWAKITDNIFVWDYGINFDNYISPFPNFHILQPNMELFRKNKATMHFSQIASIKGGDFSELRSYVVAKLLWNTHADVDSLIHTFLKGYYGNAASFLYQYLKIQEGALIGSNVPLWIYDTPVTHKSGMLNKALMVRYQALFDKAEQIVADNPAFLNHVRQSRLPIMYAELEILRTEPIESQEELRGKLDLFRQRAMELGVTTLNERNNTVEEYCNLYIQRNLSSDRKSLALHTNINYIQLPDPPYDKIAYQAITDGLYGGATFNEGWIGWCGKDGEFVIDLGEIKEMNSVETDFLHKLGAWILLPKSITCYTSVDNEKFEILGHQEIAEDKSVEVKYVNIPIKAEKTIKTRYIKIKIETIGLCPAWHYGVGNPAWFFIDEVSVY